MVRSNSIRVLVSLFFPFGVLTKLAADEGTSCTSSQGWEGLCMLSYECTGLGELVVKGYTPELCNTAGPVICCPIGSADDVPAVRPGVPSTTSRPVNISPSPTPYVAEESVKIRKVSLPSMRIRRKRPSVKRHAHRHIVVKTYDDDDGVNSILIRTHRLKPSRRRKRRPYHGHARNKGFASRHKTVKYEPVKYDTLPHDAAYDNSYFPELSGVSPTPDYMTIPDYIPDVDPGSPQEYQVSLASQLAEAKLENDQEAAFLLADMSGAHSVTVYPSRSPTSVTPRPSRSPNTVTPHPSRSRKPVTTTLAPVVSVISANIASPNSARLSKIMCDAYSEAMTETVAELSKKGVVPKRTEKCTLTSLMPNAKTTAALVGEFPHLVGLGYSDNMKTIWGKCSGTLISEEFVLTAAHCTHAPTGRPLSIGMGSRTLASDAEISIKEVILHPLYNKTTYANDLALLRLAKRTRLSDTLRPACLQTASSVPRSLVASHWSSVPVPLEIKSSSRSNETRLFNNPEVMGLQKEKMSLVKNKDCDINVELSESFICAQSTVHRRVGDERCQGYGGDALQYRNSGNKCMYTVVGIAVENVCDESPIAYTKVSNYLSWIENVVWG